MRLLTGALAALFLLATAARAEAVWGVGSSHVLTIEVIGTSKVRPEKHPVITVTLPYPTQYTCDAAAERIDPVTIKQLLKPRLDARHIQIDGVSVDCTEAGHIV